MELRMKLHLVFFLVLLFSSTIVAQDFIFEDLFGSNFSCEYGFRDKFLPEWQKVIKKNKIKREVYLIYEADKKYNPTSEVKDSVVIEYNNDGLPELITKYSNPDFQKTIILEPSYSNGKLTGLTNAVKIFRDSDGKMTGFSNQDGNHYTHSYKGSNLIAVKDKYYTYKRSGNNFVCKQEYFNDAYNLRAKIELTYDKYGRKISEFDFDIREKYKYGSNGLISSGERMRGDYGTSHYFTYKNGLLTLIKFKSFSSFGNFGGFFIAKVKYYK